MPQLSNLEKNIRRELNIQVSNVHHDIRKRCLQLADRMFAKTRFSLHIVFLSNCLRRGLILNGFLLKFHASDLRQDRSLTYKRRVSHILKVASRKLTKATIDIMNLLCQTLTEEISNIRIELKTICDHDTYRQISKAVHKLNADLFKGLSTAKGVKLCELGLTTAQFNEVADPPNSKLVVTIPENLTLTENQRSLLSKGLSFIPTRPRGDEYTAKADCESF